MVLPLQLTDVPGIDGDLGPALDVRKELGAA